MSSSPKCALGLARHGAHHRVQARTVAPAGQHRDAHGSQATSAPIGSAAVTPPPSRSSSRLDAGTTGVRAIAFDAKAGIVDARRTGSSPSTSRARAGSSTTPTRSGSTVADRPRRAGRRLPTEPVAAIGITDQRETAVVWSRVDRRAAAPRHRVAGPAHRGALRRAARRRPPPARARARTGLVLDPYFSGTKLEWLFTEGGVEAEPDLAFGTIDSGCCGSSPAARRCTPPSRPTPAARCCSTSARSRGRAELCDLFGVPLHVCPRCGRRADASASPCRRLPCRAAASRSAGSPATSRPRCSARRASSRA